MRFKRHIDFEHGLRPIDIAALMNIVFLLLIFFMFNYTFVIRPGIKVNLPRSVSGDSVKYDNLEISISPDSAIYVNNKILTAQQLKVLLGQAAKAKEAVLIKANRSSPLERVVEIWDMCRESGVAEINIVTNQK